MNSTFSNISLIETLEAIIDEMRESGVVVGAYDGANTTFTGANSLKKNDIVSIGGERLRVIEASSTSFKVFGDYHSETSYKALAPYFLYGHILEIANVLAEKSDKPLAYKYQNYPVIMLPLDIQSSYKQGETTFNNVRLIIANRALPENKASDRLTDNFIPVLYPIYEALITKLSRSPLFDNRMSRPFITHKKYDRLFWGTQLNSNSTNNVLRDYLDAVEVTELNLIVKNQNC